MKTFEEDKELRLMLKNIKLDKPAPDFTNQVMNRIFQENTLMEQVGSEPVLGKSFWIIISMFGILLAAIILSTSLVIEPSFTLPDLSTGEFMSDYRAFFNNLRDLPASIVGIFIAFSLLIFLERFLSLKNQRLFSKAV